MERVFVWPDYRRYGAVALLGVALVVAGCSERIEGGGVCPALCPTHPLSTEQVSVLADSTSQATPTVVGFPTRGNEGTILVTNRGDTLESRMIVRFDSIPATHAPTAGSSTRDSTTNIDSMRLKLRYEASSLLNLPITLNVYDVDTTAADTNDAAVLALFRPDRLVGTTTLTAADTGLIRQLPDTGSRPADSVDAVFVPIDSAWLIDRIRTGRRIRFGIQALGAGSVQIRFFGSEDAGGRYALLRFDPSPSTATTVLTFAPLSTTPVENALVAYDLNDYSVVAIPLDDPPSGAFAVGGWPARRAVMRFRLPAAIVDSATVVRATLTLTQVPAPSPDIDTPMSISANPVNARGTITDVARLAAMASDISVSAVAVRPGADSTITLELGVLVRSWANRDTIDVPRVLVLRANPEGNARMAWFFGADAPSAVKPRLEITYIPRSAVGLP